MERLLIYYKKSTNLTKNTNLIQYEKITNLYLPAMKSFNAVPQYTSDTN